MREPPGRQDREIGTEPMNTRQLEVFCQVIVRQSFSMAAEDVGLSQPAVSFQMQALEKELGTALLDRSQRRVVPTETGKILYRHARQILVHIQDLQREIDQVHGLYRGSLLLGASTGPGEHVLPQLLSQFKADRPEIDVALRILPTDEIIEQVLSYELEVGIVGAKILHPKLVFEPFVEDQLIVIAPPEHRWMGSGAVSTQELLRKPWILQQPGAGVRTMLESELAERGLSITDLNVHMEAGLQESIKTAVSAGAGIALISKFAVQQELAFGTLVQIDVHDLPMVRDQFYLVRHRDRQLSPLIRAFLSFAKPTIGKLT